MYNDEHGRRVHNPKHNLIQTNSAYRDFDGKRPSIPSQYRFKYNKPESAETEYASPEPASPRRTSTSPRSDSPVPNSPVPLRKASTKKKKKVTTKPKPTKEELYGDEGRRKSLSKGKEMRRERPTRNR